MSAFPRRAAPLAALAAALLSGAAAAGPAHASTVVVDGDQLTFTALAGEANTVHIVRVRDSDELRIRDGGVAKLADRGVVGCRPSTSLNELICRRNGLRRIRVVLGDRNDSFSSDDLIPTTVDAGPGDDLLTAVNTVVHPLENVSPAPAEVDFTGGTGHDHLRFVRAETHLTRPTDPGVRVTKNGLPDDGRPIDRINVRPDIESLEGTPRNDDLSGAGGPDVFTSTRGEDRLAGGDGDDLFLMGAVKDGPTHAIGGGGRDTATYAQRTAPIFGNLDLPGLFDGEGGERDQLEGIDVVEGGSGADVIITPQLTAVGYRLIGGAGDDSLSSGDGKDRLIGGPGADSLHSGGRADVIEARDGTRDRVDCGTNGDDTAFADGRELETRACETVFRPQPLFVGVPAMTPRTAVATAGRPVALEAAWTHPVAWKRLRRVTLTVTDRGRRVARVTLDPRSERVTAHGRSVRLVPGSARVRAARGSRRIALRLALRVDRRLAGRTLAVRLAARDARGSQAARRVGTVRVRP